MSGDLYRDAHVGIRARLLELEARIAEREAEVTEAFWAMLAHDERERLSALREGTELASADTLEELARAESMLGAYIERLDALIGKLPSIEAEWSALPDDVPSPPPPPATWFTRVTPSFVSEEIRTAFEAVVRERDRGAAFAVDGAGSWAARFQTNDSPFALRATMLADGTSQPTEVGMWLVTSIPRGLPPLVVRHESLVLSVGKALGIRHEVEVGEPSFDGLFIIEGTKEAAELYLVPPVRAQLLALSRFDVPTLEIDPEKRIASLQWRFEPAPKALDAAVRVLAAVRSMPPSFQFRTADGPVSAGGRSRR